MVESESTPARHQMGSDVVVKKGARIVCGGTSKWLPAIHPSSTSNGKVAERSKAPR